VRAQLLLRIQSGPVDGRGGSPLRTLARGIRRRHTGEAHRSRRDDAPVAFADGIRRFVAFAAEYPELNQIMVHEGTGASDRLTWMTKTHVKPFFDGIRPACQVLRDAGIAAPIDNEVLYYLFVGAVSLPYVNAAEFRLLTGRDPASPNWIDAHADGLVVILLPGLASGTP
jgi:TetR/AcrR family transcriptional regulator